MQGIRPCAEHKSQSQMRQGLGLGTPSHLEAAARRQEKHNSLCSGTRPDWLCPGPGQPDSRKTEDESRTWTCKWDQGESCSRTREQQVVRYRSTAEQSELNEAWEQRKVSKKGAVQLARKVRLDNNYAGPSKLYQMESYRVCYSKMKYSGVWGVVQQVRPPPAMPASQIGVPV